MLSPLTIRAGVVRHGSLYVAANADRAFGAAAAYLGRDAVMRGIIDKAEHASAPLHLKVNRHDDDSYDPNSRTVNWDPHSALVTTGGGRQSPALGLGHELDHATVGSRIRDLGSEIPDRAYDDREERRVILGSERHAAKTLGEATRHDHGGSTYYVASPIARRASGYAGSLRAFSLAG
jgi:hypothetical protein